MLLYNLEKNSGTLEEEDYLNECEKWQIIKFQRDHLSKLPILSKEGHFFMIFSEYFESTTLWGIQIDIEWKDFYSKRQIAPDRRIEYLMSWKNSEQEIPHPFINNGLSAIVSSQFMLIGHLLFNEPAVSDENFNKDRMSFNKVAKKEIPILVDYIVSLPNTPNSIKNLMVNYRNRFQIPIEE
ncbi:MAG: hypothetical protein GY705_07005 [Bacteroidetes bacterium]|nr:hypothetical protein [Bacteroidota bacterium]